MFIKRNTDGYSISVRKNRRVDVRCKAQEADRDVREVGGLCKSIILPGWASSAHHHGSDDDYLNKYRLAQAQGPKGKTGLPHPDMAAGAEYNVRGRERDKPLRTRNAAPSPA